MEIQYESRIFPPGTYLVVHVVPPSANTMMDAGWNDAFDRFAQVVALLDIQFPGVVHERLYEGTVATRVVQLFLGTEGGLAFGAQSYEAETVACYLQPQLNALAALSAADTARLKLASRWLRRANDSRNLIDRVLFYWTVLEVYPTTKGTKVPAVVSGFLHDRLYPQLDPAVIKDRLALGRMFGFRSKICTTARHQ
jgi:hypothetical protein